MTPAEASLRSTDAFTAPLERSHILDRVAKGLARVFSRVVRPGRAKDALAGTWLRHPLHPLLTDVTVGAWTSAYLLDVLGGEGSRPGARRLVGLGALSAVPTAVTGLSDLSDVTRREERGIGAAHAIGNTVALGAFTASYAARRNGRSGVGLSTFGMASLVVSGLLGGHLAYRLGVGVDRTRFQRKPERWTEVLDASELGEGKPHRVDVEGTDILLYRSGDRVHALANRCTHRGGPLHKGKVEDGRVTCPWHLSSFRLADGAILRGPAIAPQPTFEVREREGRIELRRAAL